MADKKINELDVPVGSVPTTRLIIIGDPTTGKMYKLTIAQLFALLSIATPTLQQVTTAGNGSTNNILFTGLSIGAQGGTGDVDDGRRFELTAEKLIIENTVTGETISIMIGEDLTAGGISAALQGTKGVYLDMGFFEYYFGADSTDTGFLLQSFGSCKVDVNRTRLKAMTIDCLNGLYIDQVPEFADNAAAILGGLVAGRVYRNGDDLKIVHA